MFEIDRATRIKLRAERYAKGEIDLETFFSLESLDEMADIPDTEPPAQEPAKAPAPAPAKKTARSRLNMTKSEWNKLSLHEQQQLYDNDPEAVKELCEQEA